ncbi:MAG: hypothetical protein KatS3mg112_0499 [Thermogutta sp.]|nr:MAG: hypothetical protein KatS3mg112_0499 [Thermogutta sp.]
MKGRAGDLRTTSVGQDVGKPLFGAERINDPPAAPNRYGRCFCSRLWSELTPQSRCTPWLPANGWTLRNSLSFRPVISEQLAESFRWDVGQTIRLNSGGKDLCVQIVGIVQQPERVPTLEKEGPTGRPVGSTIGPFLGMPPGAIYVPLDAAQEFLGMPGAINFLCLKLTPATRLDQFRRGVDVPSVAVC